MGSDIHGVFQTKQVDGEWLTIESKYEEPRHYFLFAWLGNVRNGYGFAGTPTHEPIPFLSDSRGYPDDFLINDDHHPDVPEENEDGQWLDDDNHTWMGDHSHSWLAGKEILEGRIPDVKTTGVITLEQFNEWDGITKPDSYSGGVSGHSIFVDTPETITEKTTHIQITWMANSMKNVLYFVEEVERLTKEHGEIRFVFGFDS